MSLNWVQYAIHFAAFNITECCFINPKFWFIEIHGDGQIGANSLLSKGPLIDNRSRSKFNWGAHFSVLCWSPGYDHMLIHWPVCASSEIHTWIADQKWDASYWSVGYGRIHWSSVDNLWNLLATSENLLDLLDHNRWKPQYVTILAEQRNDTKCDL